jgi:hypothetical protein
MTSRNLTTAMDAAIVAGKVRPVIFVEGSFHASGSPDEEFLRLWSGLGDFSWDSKTWTGAGKLLRISPLEESAEVKAVGFNVELSGLPPSLLSLALDNTRQGRPGRVWLGLMGREGYLDCPGITGNYASTPDSTAASITGDIDIRVQCSADDWTPTSVRELVSKSNGDASQFSYLFRLNISGTLGLFWSVDGTTLLNLNSSVSNGITDGTVRYVRATLDVDNGAGGHTARFFTSADGVTWTQLGTDQTGAGVTSLFDSSATLKVAARNTTGVGAFVGDIYAAEIRNGIDGTPAAVFDPSTDASQGVKSFTSSATGEVWTINQSGSTRAEIVMNENHLIADPYLLRSGRMDYCNISVSGEDTRITAQYEDRLIDLQKPRERRYTDQDQRNEYPTDGGFRFVTSLQDKQLIWGGPGAAASPIAAPSYADTEYPEDNGRTARSDYD